ncbi:MAG: spore coat U domain-containing protein [Ewingella sp.]
MMPVWLLIPVFTLQLLFCSALNAGTATKNFTVSATIVNGCAFGSSVTNPTTNLGTLNFGSVASVPGNLDMVSTAGTGSVVVTCTPGATVKIAMDYGTHGGSATQRYMANTTAATQTLAYQLYQDPARSKVWGNGALEMTVPSFPGTTQTYPVYARLFAVTTLPAAGTYTDTVTVTLTY